MKEDLAIFLIRKPSEQVVDAYIAREREKPFSYQSAELTRHVPGRGFNVDHNRVQLGAGRECFDAAKAAVRDWQMFNFDWLKLYRSNTPIEVGSTIAVLVRHLGFWSLNACRIVYVIEGRNPERQFGFAYGTLPGHAERGEERFSVEWNAQDDTVWYDILAVSRPGPLATIVYPYARRLQRRFARDSLKAMKRAVETHSEWS